MIADALFESLKLPVVLGRNQVPKDYSEQAKELKIVVE
jgi:hypothetical protein